MATLIELLERATGPDRHLDEAIARRIGIVTEDKSNAEVERIVPRFTESLDAARSLLPWEDHPGAEFHVRSIQSGYGAFYHFVEFTWPSTERQAHARTEPLATCICALLAIEETKRQLAPYLPASRTQSNGIPDFDGKSWKLARGH